jgi:hypothetical protein
MKLLNKSALAVLAVVVLAFVILFACVNTEYIVEDEAIEETSYWQTTPWVSKGMVVEYAFVAEHDYIKSLGVMLNIDSQEITSGDVTVSLFDSGRNLAGSASLPVTDISFRHYQEFDLNVSVEKGESYIYQISVSDCSGQICAGLIMTGTKTYPMTRYTYKDSMNVKHAEPYAVCILIFGIILSYVIIGKESKERKLLMYMFSVLAILILIFMGDEGGETLRINGNKLKLVAADNDSTQFYVNESSGYSGVVAQTNDLVLNKGTYTIATIHSVTQEGSLIEVWDNGTKIEEFQIASGSNYDEHTFTIDSDSEQLSIRFVFSGQGSMTVRKFMLTPKTRFYSDAYFMAILFVILNIIAIVIYRKNSIAPINRETLVTGCVVLGFGVLSCLPFYTTSLIGADDLPYHLVRIEGIKNALMEGQFPAVIQPGGLHGNGYLTTMYPNMFLYIAAILRIFRVSIALSYKFMMFLAGIATAYFTYISLKSMTNNRNMCYLGTALYVLLPYRFTNIYARGAVGEALAMTFMPLIIAGFYQVIFGDKEKWYYLVAGFTGVLQSHVLSTLIVAIVFVIACVLWIKELFIDKRWVQLVKAAVITVMLNLWFIVPFLFFYLKENLFFEALNWSSYTEYSVNPSFFFETIDTQSNRYLSLGLPVMCLVGVCVIVVICEKHKNKIDSYLKYLFAVGCIISFMITGYFASRDFMEIGLFDKLFTTIQFPWRLFGIAAILFIFSGCIWLGKSKLLGKYANVLAVALIAVNILSGLNVPYNSNNFAYSSKSDTHTIGHESKVTGIVKSDSSIIEPYEWRIGNIEDSEITTVPSTSSDENVQILSFEKNGTKASIEYTSDTQGQYIEFPLMNYIGYVAKDENGEKLNVDTGSHGRLRVWINGDNNTHVINVKYQIPFIFKIATGISLLSYVAVLVVCLMNKFKNQKNQEN